MNFLKSGSGREKPAVGSRMTNRALLMSSSRCVAVKSGSRSSCRAKPATSMLLKCIAGSDTVLAVLAVLPVLVGRWPSARRADSLAPRGWPVMAADIGGARPCEAIEGRVGGIVTTMSGESGAADACESIVSVGDASHSF